MSTLPKSFLTPEQYLELERDSETRHEYYDGQMFAMAGAEEPHVVLVANLVTSLNTQLRDRDCRVYSTDMRVNVSATGLYTYPDVVVACGERRFLPGRRGTLLNPTVIIEVLSASTERYDRGRKFDHYGTIESLRHYVLVAADRVAVHVFTREDGDWRMQKALQLGETVDLAAVGCKLSLADLYNKVEFESQAGA
jgi:Uma2 family endonuclease